MRVSAPSRPMVSRGSALRRGPMRPGARARAAKVPDRARSSRVVRASRVSLGAPQRLIRRLLRDIPCVSRARVLERLPACRALQARPETDARRGALLSPRPAEGPPSVLSTHLSGVSSQTGATRSPLSSRPRGRGAGAVRHGASCSSRVAVPSTPQPSRAARDSDRRREHVLHLRADDLHERVSVSFDGIRYRVRLPPAFPRMLVCRLLRPVERLRARSSHVALLHAAVHALAPPAFAEGRRGSRRVCRDPTRLLSLESAPRTGEHEQQCARRAPGEDGAAPPSRDGSLLERHRAPRYAVRHEEPSGRRPMVSNLALSCGVFGPAECEVGPVPWGGYEEMSTTGSAQNSVRRWLLEQLTPESLAHTAERITGLSDAYTEDRPREALEVLARSLREEAGLTTSGLLTLRAHLIGTLMTRMRVQRDLRTLPEISSAPLPRPVFIVGVLRTGTTLLHHLLAQDPRARAPALWELMFPSPPPDPRAHETDTRVRWTDEYLAETFRRMPDLFALHPMESDAPDECQWLMRNSFQTGNYAFTYRVPTYGRWIGRADHDMVPVYRFYRAQLQLLT
ncbi:MAG: sulfotransferase, partial [Deltaproteobacteria bacterium]